MPLKMRCDLPLDFTDLFGDRLQQRLQAGFDRGDEAAFGEPIRQLRLLLDQIVQMANQDLQFARFLGWRMPRLRILLPREERDQSSVGAVGLITPQFAFGKAFDARWIDHAYL